METEGRPYLYVLLQPRNPAGKLWRLEGEQREKLKHIDVAWPAKKRLSRFVSEEPTLVPLSREEEWRKATHLWRVVRYRRTGWDDNGGISYYTPDELLP